MSMKSLIRGCDHDGCDETYDQLDLAQRFAGWTMVETPIAGPLTVTRDYCPTHSMLLAFRSAVDCAECPNRWNGKT